MPPYVNISLSGNTPSGYITYSLSEIISPIVFFKIYHIFKLYCDLTIWLSPQVKALSKRFSVDFSITFAIRADLKLKSLVIIIPIAVSVILVFGYSLRNMERGYTNSIVNSEFFQYATNGWWVSIITMTTVGYGDVFPVTDSGRFFTFLLAIVGLILVSLYVSSLSSAIRMNKVEFNSYNAIKRMKNNLEIEIQASNIIKEAMRLKQARNTKTIRESFFYVIRLRKIALNPKDMNLRRHLEPAEMLVLTENKIERDIDYIRGQFIDVGYITGKLKDIQKDQKEIEENMKMIVIQQAKIYSSIIDCDLRVNE